MIERLIALDKKPRHSFFLWGPRQCGKSTWLKHYYPDALWIDLLKSDEFVRYQQSPALLRAEAQALRSDPDVIVVDEIQKVPALLDEVHWLIENTPLKFVLCGSSARKLKRGRANLLGGRAIRRELFGFCRRELGTRFDLVRILNRGYLPRHYLSHDWPDLLRAYTADYLKEEIAAEGMVRNLPVFSHFLSCAALSDTETVNFSTIARDVGVSSHTIREYFAILEDTLLGRWLPAYQKRPKRRIVKAAKFYFFDVGVVNHLAKRGHLEPRTELFGKAFENWLIHELTVYSHYQKRYFDFSHWRLTTGNEVDLIIDDMRIAIEAKATPQVNANHLKGLRALQQEHPAVKARLVVSLDPKRRLTPDGIEIIPYTEFMDDLWQHRFD